MFERFAIDLLLMSKNQTKSAALLRTSFDSINHIMHRAVERGLSRRENTTKIAHLGIDEKSFKSNHHYISALSDLEGRRILDSASGIEHRTVEASKTLINTALSQEQRESVESISIDMWDAFMNAASETLPQADIVHDRYHISTYLNGAVDATRRTEAKALAKHNDTALKGSKYIFLKNPENLTDVQQTRFEQIQSLNLSTSEAWRMKENFKGFFESTTVEDARAFFNEWFNNVHASAIAPMKKVAVMLQKHLQGLLNYVKHHITNAVAECLNALIQEIKYVARGFRRFENFRVAILFFLGKLDLYPQKSR
jgi:transposase